MPAHIQARIWSPNPGDVLNDEANWPNPGEVFYDPNRRCFGVYSGTGNTIDWFPRLEGNYLRLKAGQRLTGRDSTESNNSLYLDFNTPGEIQVKALADDSVALRINAGGIIGVTTPSRPNLLTNPGLNLRRSFIKPNNPKTMLVAPNWQAWMSNVTGSINAAFSDDVPTGVPANSSLAFRSDPGNPPPNCGLRSAYYDLLSLANQTVTASVYLKGPNGDSVTSRVLNNSQVFASTPVTGTGAWVRNTLTWTMPSRSVIESMNGVMVFDMLYNPKPNNSTPWYVAAPVLNLGPAAAPFEYRGLEAERQRALSIYSEQRVILTKNSSVLIHLNLIPGNLDFELQNTSTASVTVSAADERGALVTAPNDPTITGPFYATLASFNMPLLTESTGS